MVATDVKKAKDCYPGNNQKLWSLKSTRSAMSVEKTPNMNQPNFNGTLLRTYCSLWRMIKRKAHNVRRVNSAAGLGFLIVSREVNACSVRSAPQSSCNQPLPDGSDGPTSVWLFNQAWADVWSSGSVLLRKDWERSGMHTLEALQPHRKLLRCTIVKKIK